MTTERPTEPSTERPTERAPIYEKSFEVRWADCDANQHMRHSAYADFCGHTRVGFLDSIGLDQAWFNAHRVGPVLFKDETEYQREAHISEVLRVTIEVGEPTGFSKSIQIVQKMYKATGELAAIHRCVVGFMDLEVRKIVALPDVIAERFPVVAGKS